MPKINLSKYKKSVDFKGDFPKSKSEGSFEIKYSKELAL